MGSYAENLRAKGIGFLKGGQTKPKIVEGRDAEGNRTRAVTDELGHTVTEHNNKLDQVDVLIKAPQVRIGKLD